MREIPGFPGYLADDQGRIYSSRTGELVELTQRIHKGYPHVFIKTGYGRNTKRKEPVHKLVLFAFIGPRPTGMECRHLDGDPLNNRLSNLKWGTHRENMQDQVRHGTAVGLRTGEDHPRTKLKSDQVLYIKQLIVKGMNNVQIAEIVGVRRDNIQDIRVGKSWRHLKVI